MLQLKSRCTLGVGSLLRSSLGSLAVSQRGVLVGLPAHFLLILLSALHILHSSDFFFNLVNYPLLSCVKSPHSSYLSIVQVFFPTICLVLAFSYLIFSVFPPFASPSLMDVHSCKEGLTLQSSSCPSIIPLPRAQIPSEISGIIEDDS